MKRFIKGSVTIEIAIGLPIFIAVIGLWFELCVMMIAFNIADNALVTAVFNSKKQGNIYSDSAINYQEFVEKTLKEAAGFLWPTVIDPESVTSRITYFKTREDVVVCSKYAVVMENCSQSSIDPEGMAIALYQLEYTYRPMFGIGIPEMPVRREYFAIQEYERCSFKHGVKEGHYCEK